MEFKFAIVQGSCAVSMSRRLPRCFALRRLGRSAPRAFGVKAETASWQGCLPGFFFVSFSMARESSRRRIPGRWRSGIGRARRRALRNPLSAWPSSIVQPDADAELRLWHALVDQPFMSLAIASSTTPLLIDTQTCCSSGPCKDGSPARRVVQIHSGNRHRQQGPRADPIQFRPKFSVDGDILVIFPPNSSQSMLNAIELILCINAMIFVMNVALMAASAVAPTKPLPVPPRRRKRAS